MAQLGDTVITGSLSVTNSIHGTADNAIYSNYSRQGAYCTTAAGTAAKVASMAGYVLQSGATFPITFTIANTSASALTLAVNSTTAKPIYINGTASGSNNYTLPAGTYLCYYYDNKYYIDTGWAIPFARKSSSADSATTATDVTYPYTNTDIYCNTAAGTAAKVGRCKGFVLYQNCVLLLRVATTNTAAVDSLTLDVNSTGALSITINGAAVSASNQLSAGLYIACYTGSTWALIRNNPPTVTKEQLLSNAFSVTAGATAEKVVRIGSYKLVAGTRFRLYLAALNTKASATLKVNDTTAKEVRISGNATTTNNFTAGWHDVVYDGTYYQVDTAFQSNWTQTDSTKADFIKNKIPIWITSGTAVDSTATILLNMVYPVGSVYMSVNNVSPQSFLGGTWQAITDGRFVRASGSNAASVPTIAQIKAGTGIQAEGLPNITGSIASSNSTYGIGSNNGSTNVGALKGEEFNKKTSAGTSSGGSYMNKISFDASLGNSTVPDGASSGKIYGNSDHVTPKNMSVYMWVRTA